MVPPLFWAFQEVVSAAVMGGSVALPEMRTRAPLKVPIEESESKRRSDEKSQQLHCDKTTGNLPERPILFSCTTRPCHQSPGFEPRSIALCQKGNSDPAGLAPPQRVWPGTTPKPASAAAVSLPPALDIPDKRCHRLNLSLRNGCDRTSPPITMETGSLQTQMQPSLSVQPSAQRQTSIVQ